jgi:hypothetical protein
MSPACQAAQQMFPDFTVHHDEEAPELSGNVRYGPEGEWGECRGDGNCYAAHSECVSRRQLAAVSVAMEKHDVRALTRLISEGGHVSLNMARKAVQVTDCKGTRVVGHFALSDAAFQLVVAGQAATSAIAPRER